MDINNKKKKRIRLIEVPDLLEEWDYEKNVGVDPEELTIGVHKKYWWKCGKGHEWEAAVSNRYHGAGCPYCKGKRIIAGENDLESRRPDLMRFWDYSQDLNPAAVSVHSEKRAWWVCEIGHRWKAQIKDVSRGTRCPYCAGRKIAMGYNDLMTAAPTLAAQWDYEKNGSLTPDTVAPNARKKVWWICPEGHSWQAAVYHRNRKTNCPYCSGNMVIAGVTDLETIAPDLAEEWCYELNNCSPKDVAAMSNKRIWWQCDQNHRWLATVFDRRKGDSCPYCSGKKAISGETDVFSLYPALRAEWAFDKNVNIDPEQLRPSSGYRVWWRCASGHSWRTSVQMRVRGQGCPYCLGQTPTRGRII